MKINVKIDEQVFEVEISDLAARPIVALVDGQCFEVWPEEKSSPAQAEVKPIIKTTPMPVSPKPVGSSVPATPAGNTDKAKTVLAPIPGAILSVAVCAGATVKVGQEICVLEAMKMKNTIRSARAGVIANVYISNGDHVKHGQVLVDFME